MNTVLQKEYRLIYFKYAPEDVLIKVYPENPTSTEEENTDYIISKLDKSSVNLFLVKRVPNEREFINYKYRVVFYKPQLLGSTNVNVPIYSFQLYFRGETAIVKYEPSKAIPKEIKENNLEKSFAKHPSTNIYFIKDYNGEDFLLSEKMRKVKFIGKTKNSNGTYTSIQKDSNMRIKLLKVEGEEDKDSSNVSSDIKKDYIFEVPLNTDVTVGLVPYKLDNISEYTRFVIDSIVVDNKESQTKLIHFAEIWNNMYEQELVFKDDGYFVDFKFDPELYNLEYSIDSKEMVKQKESPLSLSLKENNGKDIKINLTAKDFVIKYLKHPTETMDYKFMADKKAVEVIKNLNEKYYDFTEITGDGSLLIKPNFNRISFAIFSNPVGSKIKYKRIEPSSKKTDYQIVELGESPVFFESFDFGKYQITATWYEKDEKSGNIKEYFLEKSVEFCEPPSKKYMKDISYLKKGETEIPYLMFYLLDAIESNDYKRDAKPDIEVITDKTDKKESSTNNKNKKDTTSDVTKKEMTKNDISSDIVTSNNKKEVTKIDPIKKDTTTDNKVENSKKDLDTNKNKIDTYKKEDVKLLKRSKEDLKYIIKSEKSKVDNYYIQIAAFQVGERPLSFINFYAEVFANEYNKMYNRDIKSKLFLANKTVNQKEYQVIVYGKYFNPKDVESDIKHIHKIVNDAFIVNEKLLNGEKL